jgi:diguanylate cyclase (GGDEF)-like protein
VVKIDQDGGLFQLHTGYLPEMGETEKSKQVWTTITDADKNLFIGTSDTVFKQHATGESERLVVAGLGDIPGIIRTLKPKLSGGFWVGASEGLYVLSAEDSQVAVITEPFDLVGIDPTDVFSVTETLNGDLWLALYNVGVLRWNPEQNKAELLQALDGNSLTDMNISVIYADNLQHIWIGSNLAGVFKYQPDNQQIDFFSHEFGNNNSLSSNRVKDIFQDSQGDVWIATARGLNLFMPETQGFRQYTQADGLLNDSIGSIHEDSKQNLWLSYQFGLSRFNPEKQEINNYMLNEAISNYGFGNRSSAIGVDDVIYIGSVNGYYTFDPKLLKPSRRYEPPIKLTQVWINSQPQDYSNTIAKQNTFDLFYEDRSIAFEFAALDYKSPEHIKYRYRIMGLNDEWLNISSNRLIELNHLNPGDYQIEVKAVNNDGRWTEQMMTINLNIHPVWWNKGWVRLLFACSIIILALFFHQFRTHKIRKQNLLLEDEVKSRTSELHDLNVQLKKAAHSDYLTKLPNRMAFIKAIEQKPQQDIGDGDCIVMADIDYFKQINDQYGHDAGDLILVKVGELMREMIRTEDMIARWGGEEFIFYFEGKSAKQVLPMIDRIRETIEKAQFKYADKIISVTLTFGICQSQQGMSLNDCIIKADEAMYAGKAKGRNAVIIADIKTA